MILTEQKINQLEEIIHSSLDNLYQNDIKLIQCGGMEQAISFRFGSFLLQQCQQINWLRHFDIDMEYNKNGLNSKLIPRRPNGVRPDLIIHTRNSNEGNLMIVEIKGWWNAKTREKDINKIKEFVHQGGEYKYGYGVFLDLGRTECKPQYFKDY